MSTPVDHFAGPRADLFRCHTRGQRWVCPVLHTLKELLWVRYFATVEELRLALLEFKRVYNEKWLLERHNYQVRRSFQQELSKAA